MTTYLEKILQSRESFDLEQKRKKEQRKHNRKENKTRNAQIIKSVLGGDKPSLVARRYGISRQRVNQITNPIKTKARQLTADAIRLGKLEKEPCVECGILTVEAHHPDYDDPLNIIWICKRHHTLLHLS